MTFNDENMVEDETLDSPEAEEAEQIVEDEPAEEEEESVEDLKARLAKAEELANNYKVRAEKAEKKPKAVTSNDSLSTSDIIALTRANINDEDIDEVVNYAKYQKISVSEALKTDVIQATLNTREEKRKSAQAVHVGSARRASTNKSDERILDDARNGRMPESEADIAKLAELRLKSKRR